MISTVAAQRLSTMSFDPINASSAAGKLTDPAERELRDIVDKRAWYDAEQICATKSTAA